MGEVCQILRHDHGCLGSCAGCGGEVIDSVQGAHPISLWQIVLRRMHAATMVAALELSGTNSAVVPPVGYWKYH